MKIKNLFPRIRRRLRFYRHHSSDELMWGRVYYSQYGEDIFLTEYFRGKQNGFYIDVGAFHPICYSNTYALYRSGWRGITIEPNPEKLVLFRKFRPQDQMLTLAISDKEGTATFAVEEEFSGIVSNEFSHQNRLSEMRLVEVNTKPLRNVLAEHMKPHDQPIDILTVDCEGHDAVILESNDWETYRPLLVLCEAFGAEGARRLEAFLARQAYRKIAACGPTLIFEDMRDPSRRPPAYH